MKNTFQKTERLCSRTAIEQLFSEPSHVITVWPFRVVYRIEALSEDVDVIPFPQVLISVPKKRFHHATDRNRIKRLVREAYRTQKQPLIAFSHTRRLSMAIAVVCLTDTLSDTDLITQSMQQVVMRMIRQLSKE